MDTWCLLGLTLDLAASFTVRRTEVLLMKSSLFPNVKWLFESLVIKHNVCASSNNIITQQTLFPHVYYNKFHCNNLRRCSFWMTFIWLSSEAVSSCAVVYDEYCMRSLCLGLEKTICNCHTFLIFCIQCTVRMLTWFKDKFCQWKCWCSVSQNRSLYR